MDPIRATEDEVGRSVDEKPVVIVQFIMCFSGVTKDVLSRELGCSAQFCLGRLNESMAAGILLQPLPRDGVLFTLQVEGPAQRGRRVCDLPADLLDHEPLDRSYAISIDAGDMRPSTLSLSIIG